MMEAACLVAEYESREAAEVGVEVLHTEDFHDDAISIARRGEEEALQKLDRQEAERGDVEADKAVGVGAAIAAIAGVPISVFSMVGPIMVAGPLAAVGGGAVAGGLYAAEEQGAEEEFGDSPGLYAMANRVGINAHDAAHYEDRIRDGAILVIVTSTPPRLGEAQRVLKTTNPVSLRRFSFRDPQAEE